MHLEFHLTLSSPASKLIFCARRHWSLARQLEPLSSQRFSVCGRWLSVKVLQFVTLLAFWSIRFPRYWFQEAKGLLCAQSFTFRSCWAPVIVHPLCWPNSLKNLQIRCLWHLHRIACASQSFFVNFAGRCFQSFGEHWVAGQPFVASHSLSQKGFSAAQVLWRELVRVIFWVHPQMQVSWISSAGKVVETVFIRNTFFNKSGSPKQERARICVGGKTTFRARLQPDCTTKCHSFGNTAHTNMNVLFALFVNSSMTLLSTCCFLQQSCVPGCHCRLFVSSSLQTRTHAFNVSLLGCSMQCCLSSFNGSIRLCHKHSQELNYV